MSYKTRCRDCGGPIVLVLLIPRRLVQGTARKWIPLDPTPSSDVRPSHAVSAGWTVCRPITLADEIGPDEHPALTHFATCPVRLAAAAPTGSASKAQEGTP